MARTFDKSAGTNYISLGANTISALLNGASAVSLHCWTKYNSFDALDSANSDRSVQILIAGSGAGTTGLAIVQDGTGGTTSQKHRIVARSVSTDALQGRSGTTNLVTGTWYSLGGVVDINGDTITPYLNGTAEGGGAVTFGNTTWTNGTPTGTDKISDAGTGTVQQLDGQCCEVAIWNVALNAGEMLALSKGFSAALIRPQSLVFYMPLIGRVSPELDWMRSKTGTITGSCPQADHPRIIYAQRNEIRKFGTTAAAGGTAWTQTVTNSITPSQSLVKAIRHFYAPALNVLGPDQPTLWGSFSWGTGYWGTTGDLRTSVGKYWGGESITPDQTLATTIGYTRNFDFGTLEITAEPSAEYLGDGSGWNYVFPGPAENAENRSETDYTEEAAATPTFSSAAAGSDAFTSAAAATSTYTTVSKPSTTWG